MGMKRPRYNLGRVDWIGVESVGLPGQRTFRVLVSSGGTHAQLWLEKEQLQALAEAIARMLVEVDSERGLDLRRTSPTGGAPKPAGFPESPEIEFHVGSLNLLYESQRDLIAMEAADRESDESDTPIFRCLASREQMEALQNNSLEVVSAGRPRCPLCGTPLTTAGMPHFCPPTNGHQKLTADEE